MGLDARKYLFWVCEQQRGQPAVPPTDMRFVICFFISISYKLSSSKITFFYLVSVAEETGLSLTLSDTQNRLDITNMISNLDRINSSFICI